MLAPRPAPTVRQLPARRESSPLPRALRAILGRGGAPRPSPTARCEGGCSASPHACAPSPTRGLKRCSGSARPRRGTVREIEPRAAGRARHVGLRFLGRGAWGGNAICSRKGGSRKGRCPGLWKNAGLGDFAWKGGVRTEKANLLPARRGAFLTRHLSSNHTLSG